MYKSNYLFYIYYIIGSFGRPLLFIIIKNIYKNEVWYIMIKKNSYKKQLLSKQSL
jgi:hypothetical protein